MEEPHYPRSKRAIVKAYPSIVGVITYDAPVEYGSHSTCKFAYFGHGIVLECEVAENATYCITIVAPAVLFKRTNDIKPRQVKFDVRVPDGKKLCKGELVDCDFHYNLAAIRINFDSPLQPATLRALNDVWSIHLGAYEHPQSHVGNPFHLPRHSNLFAVQPGTEIILLYSSFDAPFSAEAVCGVFCTIYDYPYAGNELYWVDCDEIEEKPSGAVVNLSGEVIGIMFCEKGFLPSNIISRWWDHYKSKGTFCRPWVGVDIANLSEACLSFLERFKKTFPEIGTGVIVTQVEEDSPACKSGIRLNDVIVKCGGECVRSKMEFFDITWDNVGESVDLKVLRSSDGQRLDLTTSIREIAETNYYPWMLPYRAFDPRSFTSSSSDSDDEQFDSSDDQLSYSSDDQLSESAPEETSDIS